MAIAVLAVGVSGLAFGQVPAPPYYAMDPASPLTPRASSPVQQQILENYRSQLLQAQRQGLQQNPAGLGREQLEINRQLNTYALPGSSAPAPGIVAAPSSIPGTVPAPPFNAAPRP